MRVHIFTGAKGGVGKTLLALTTTATYLNRGENVLALDLNFHNQDLYRILTQLGYAEEKHNAIDKQFNFSTFEKYRGAVASPRPGDFILYDNRGFWKLINQALIFARNELSFPIDQVIIDTGLHLANLLPQDKSDNITILEEINKLSKKIKIRELYIWFIWTPATISFPISSAIDKTVTKLEMLDRIFTSTNIIHVINPGASANLGGVQAQLRKLVDGKNYIIDNSLKELSRAHSVPSISIDKCLVILNNIRKYDTEKSNSIAPSFWKDFANAILEIEKGRPLNVFPIPIFDNALVGYTDDMQIKQIKGFHQIESLLDPISDYIGNYLLEIEQKK